MKFCVLTLGCKVNTYESDFIKEQFKDNGYEEVKIDNEPNVVIINTCSVTNQSDAKSRHIIRMARKMAPNSILVACGCSCQNHKTDLKELGIDILLGNKDKSKILEYVENYKQNNQPISKFYDMQEQDFETMFIKNETDKTRAFVKIQDGCDNYCSYCIIPFLRGNIRSKDINLAEQEINSLVEMGHKEIVLTGIHTGSYGRNKGYDLVDLIRRASMNPKLERIRISSIEITELDEKFIEELKNNPKICDHLHIPLQSGSDEVLKRMNRKYDTNYYKQKIDTLRNIRPNISITTDLIIGFPYETDDEFNKVYEFLKEIKFTKIHVFPFSLRNGTKAEEMKKHFVKDITKKERVKKVLELSRNLEEEYYKKHLGKKLSVIFETNKDGISKGHTSNYILVSTDKIIEPGITKDIIINEVDGTNVKGNIVEVD